MNKTKIEYLTHTWSPIAMLCEPVSEGCRNCWHRRRAKMLAKNPLIPRFQQRAYAGENIPVLIPSRIDDPFKRKKPSIIGVQYMGDLWHKHIDWPMIDQVFEACHKAPWHTYIFLTKRIEAAWYYFNSPVYPEHKTDKHRSEYLKSAQNIYFGTSVENKEMADIRIKFLIQIPAAVRLVSAEPMLEEIDIRPWLYPFRELYSVYKRNIKLEMFNKYQIQSLKEPIIDWVIAGPETGPKARPMPIGAITGIYHQCRDAGIPFFDKRSNYLAREFPI